MDRSIIVVCMTLVMSYIVRSKWFQKFVMEKGELAHSLSQVNVNTPDLVLTKRIPKQFISGSKTNLGVLADVLSSLQSYKVATSRRNDILMDRVKTLDTRKIEELNRIGYIDKISKVQNAISVNSLVVEDIVKHTISRIKDQENEYSDEVRLLVETVKNANTDVDISRVNEAISHLCRDYNDEFNRREIAPLVKYINTEINKIDRGSKTLIVVPGSGTGYIPYALATQYSNCEVDSIEMSGLMYLCNEYMMNNHKKDITIKPFAQFYSGQQDSSRQIRGFNINVPGKRPQNLQNLWGNFLEYIPRDSEYDTIVVVSAYFIDTAANMFDYIDKIESLKHYGKKIHWINIGPLKYGTYPIVQLTGDEITKYMELHEWSHLDVEIDANARNAYLTDPESLYKGYYGLYKFHAFI